MDLGPCFVYVCFHVHVYNEKQAQLGVVHGPGPQRWSMDRVHGVVHGPGPQGWSMDPGPCFVYVHRDRQLDARRSRFCRNVLCQRVRTYSKFCV